MIILPHNFFLEFQRLSDKDIDIFSLNTIFFKEFYVCMRRVISGLIRELR